MKRFLFLLVVGALLSGNITAQRLRIGVRGGFNVSDYDFSPVEVGDARFYSGPLRAGFETGLVVRLNLTKHLHLQSELNYDFVNYSVRAEADLLRTLRMRSERLELPVQLGFQFGVLRLFGGVSFRLYDTSHSSVPDLLKIDYNDNMAVMGGLGVNIKRFFLDLRVQGYPRSHVWNTFTSGDETMRVKVNHDIIYGGSIGFFF